jgi:hypothetical protein
MSWFFRWRRLPRLPPLSLRRAAGSCRSFGRSVVRGSPWWVRRWSGGAESWTPPSGGIGHKAPTAPPARDGGLVVERPPRASSRLVAACRRISTDHSTGEGRLASIVHLHVTDMSRRLRPPVTFPQFTAGVWTVLPGRFDRPSATRPAGTRWLSPAGWSCSPWPSRGWRAGSVPRAWRGSPSVARGRRRVRPAGPSLPGADRADHGLSSPAVRADRRVSRTGTRR